MFNIKNYKHETDKMNLEKFKKLTAQRQQNLK